MRRILFICVVIFCASHARAACTTSISAGSNSSQVQTALNSCSSGSTASFPAGTYSFSITVTVPCGVSMTGPVVNPGGYTTGDGYRHWGYTPTAIINSSATPAFNLGSCTTARTTQYLEVNGGQPAGGGMAFYFGSGASNQTVQYNYLHGNNSPSNSGSNPNASALVFFDGPGQTSDPVDTSNTIIWNRFGATNDCENSVPWGPDNNMSYSTGGCVGFATHTGHLNLTIENNVTYYQEQGQKFFEGPPESTGVSQCINCITKYNDWSNIHRIAFESQVTRPNGSPSNVGSYNTQYVQYNSMHDQLQPNPYTYGLSDANGCGNGSGNNPTNPGTGGCITHTDYNVLIANTNTPSCTGSNCYTSLGIEEWGGAGNTDTTSASYNLIQGEWANDISVAQDGQFVDNGNIMQNSYGNGGHNTPDGCTPGLSMPYGWWNLNGNNYPERGDPPQNVPTGTGNECDFYNGSLFTSVTPSTTPCTGTPPSCGTYSTPQVVTFHNNGTNRDSNTTIWYTTDGSPPACASGTSKPLSDLGTITVSTTTTIKYIGMWGAPNQPCSYPTGPISPGGSPAGYGYQPSAVQTATYTIGGGPTLTSCSQTNSGSVTTLTVGQTAAQQIGQCYYASVPTTTTCSPGMDTYGNTIISWGSNNTSVLNVGTIGSASGCTAGLGGTVGPGCAVGVVAGSAQSTATATGSVTCSNYSFTVVGPTLTGVSISLQSGGTTVPVGTLSQACATMTYTGVSNTVVCGSGPDIYGTTPNTWTSSAPSYGTITSSGLVAGIASGSTNIGVSAGAFTSSPETISIVAPVSSPSSLTGAVNASGGVQVQ